MCSISTKMLQALQPLARAASNPAGRAPRLWHCLRTERVIPLVDFYDNLGLEMQQVCMPLFVSSVAPLCILSGSWVQGDPKSALMFTDQVCPKFRKAFGSSLPMEVCPSFVDMGSSMENVTNFASIIRCNDFEAARSQLEGYEWNIGQHDRCDPWHVNVFVSDKHPVEIHQKPQEESYEINLELAGMEGWLINRQKRKILQRIKQGDSNRPSLEFYFETRHYLGEKRDRMHKKIAWRTTDPEGRKFVIGIKY